LSRRTKYSVGFCSFFSLILFYFNLAKDLQEKETIFVRLKLLAEQFLFYLYLGWTFWKQG